jgi:twitching motility protein PilT
MGRNRIMEIMDIFKRAIEKKASDIFIIAGRPVSYKILGDIVTFDDEILTADDTYKTIKDIFKIANEKDLTILEDKGDADFSFSVSKLGRFRVSTYKQRNSYAAVIRVVFFELPDPEKLGIPDVVMNLYKKNQGADSHYRPCGQRQINNLGMHNRQNKQGKKLSHNDF